MLFFWLILIALVSGFFMIREYMKAMRFEKSNPFVVLSSAFVFAANLCLGFGWYANSEMKVRYSSVERFQIAKSDSLAQVVAGDLSLKVTDVDELKRLDSLKTIYVRTSWDHYGNKFVKLSLDKD